MGKKDTSGYRPPGEWLAFTASVGAGALSDALAAISALTALPFERSWLEGSESAAMRTEAIASWQLAGDGTSLEAVEDTYAWIAALPLSTPVTLNLFDETHSRLRVDRPGLRRKGDQVCFGRPPMRGAKGGRKCRESLEALADALQTADAPMLVKGLAAHYHLLAIHPWYDGNGRTARAVEALFRRKAGLTGPRFLATSDLSLLSHAGYTTALSTSRQSGHDLTPFLNFALPGLTARVRDLTEQIRGNLAQTVFEGTSQRLFGSLATGKRRAMAQRQIALLRVILTSPRLDHQRVYERLGSHYDRLKNPWKAFLRDVHDLLEIGAIQVCGGDAPLIEPVLDWPASINEDVFFQHYRDEPRSGVVFSAVG